MTASSTCVVDLALLRRAAGPLIGCYERFLSEGSVDLHDLDDALASLRVLPFLEGRVGRAIALVTSGGAGAPTEQTLAALELLRTTTALRPAPEVALSPALTKNRSAREAGPTQLCLPGMNSPLIV